MKKWERVTPTDHHTVGYRRLVTKNFKMPDGSIQSFDTKNPEGSMGVGTVALTENNKVIIARQFRPGPEIIMDELPGGVAHDGEDPERAARRELIEETGYEPGEMKHIGPVYKDAYTNTAWNYYLATNCRKVTEQSLDEHEHVDVHLISINKLLANARNGLMTDVEAIFLAYDFLKKLK